MESIIDITQGHYLLLVGNTIKACWRGGRVKRVDDTPKTTRIVWWNNSKTLIRSWDGLGESFRGCVWLLYQVTGVVIFQSLSCFKAGPYYPLFSFWEGGLGWNLSA